MKTKEMPDKAGTPNGNTHKDNNYLDNELIFSEINECLNDFLRKESELIQQNNERIRQILEIKPVWRVFYVAYLIVLIISIIL